ncbi:hypothetical protein IAU59_002143 [Kwoniella sp. CBS 9459]
MQSAKSQQSKSGPSIINSSSVHIDSSTLPSPTHTLVGTAEGSSEKPETNGRDSGDHVCLLSKGMIKLYGVWSVAFLATFMAGYGIGSLTAINAMDRFQSYFNFGSGGLVFSMWPIAGCVTFWLGPIFADRLGRRGGMLISSLTFLLGTSLMAFTKSYGMLLAGRFFLGVSVGWMQPAALPYIAELAPPLNRGLLAVSIFHSRNICLLHSFVDVLDTVLGNASATVVGILTNDIDSDWSWRLPLVVQLICPAIMASTVMLLPESPRWLYAHGKGEQARAVLAKYHGNGLSTTLVAKEIGQIAASLQVAPKKMWDYANLADTRAKRYRLGLALLIGIGGQAPSLFRQVGMTSVKQQLIMTLIPTLIGLVSAAFGTWCSDRLGRRPMLVCGTFLCAIFLALAMACSAVSLKGATTTVVDNYNDAASKGTIAFLVLFYSAFCWTYIPLFSTYPPEVLRMEQRSTGLGLMVLCLNAASVLAQLTTPIALEMVGWWTYFPWICSALAQSVIYFLVAVETKGRTLEELDQIFDSPGPVKASLKYAQRAVENPSSEATNTAILENAARSVPSEGLSLSMSRPN